jgi:hypothetical protein
LGQNLNPAAHPIDWKATGCIQEASGNFYPRKYLDFRVSTALNARNAWAEWRGRPTPTADGFLEISEGRVADMAPHGAKVISKLAQVTKKFE